ncbi:hypothetical protein ABZ646_16440 [Streptomyces sp. NPDC007162]|uniref:hypothetical protein n=1 Tax=Streptomyces sp. NPDC007162 TaxID=3156917 RepID=UPI0033FAD728
MTPGPLIGEAFEHEEVALHIATLTSESLDAHIRARIVAPRRITLRTVLEQLRTENLVPPVDLQIRRTELAPTFKLCVINHDEVLHGFYEPIPRTVILEGGTEVEAVDVLGPGATLTHHVRNADPDNATRWFESVWQLLVSRP